MLRTHEIEADCADLFQSIGHHHAHRIVGRIVLEGISPDQAASEMRRALDSIAAFARDRSICEHDVEIMLGKVCSHMLEEGRRLISEASREMGRA